MTATVMDMTGRVLEQGEEITENAREQAERAELHDIWHSSPEIVREWADGHDLEYPFAVEVMVHSLLSEAQQGAKKHERAAQVLEFVRSRFFAEDEE